MRRLAHLHEGKLLLLPHSTHPATDLHLLTQVQWAITPRGGFLAVGWGEGTLVDVHTHSAHK